MKRILITIVLMITSTCLADDPIAALTADLNSQAGGLWLNGQYPILKINIVQKLRDLMITVN